MKKILVIDNYDSFTYNLVYLLKQFADVKVDVVRNDFVKMEEVKDYDKILFSPGPGVPQEAGMMKPKNTEINTGGRRGDEAPAEFAAI